MHRCTSVVIETQIFPRSHFETDKLSNFKYNNYVMLYKYAKELTRNIEFCIHSIMIQYGNVTIQYDLIQYNSI